MGTTNDVPRPPVRWSRRRGLGLRACLGRAPEDCHRARRRVSWPLDQDRFSYKTTCGYDIQAPYWAENGGIFGWPDVIWAREAEVKHGRIAMLAATGLIVQDLFTFPFYGKWYTARRCGRSTTSSCPSAPPSRCSPSCSRSRSPSSRRPSLASSTAPATTASTPSA